MFIRVIVYVSICNAVAGRRGYDATISVRRALSTLLAVLAHDVAFATCCRCREQLQQKRKNTVNSGGKT